VTDEPAVRITLATIYDQLVAMDKRLDPLPEKVGDHEKRLRDIEEREDLSRRVASLESSVKGLERRVWAIPGAGTVIAGAAVVITLIVKF